MLRSVRWRSVLAFVTLMLTMALAISLDAPVGWAQDRDERSRDLDDWGDENFERQPPDGDIDQTPRPDDEGSSARRPAPEYDAPEGCPYQQRDLELIV